jgi:hypothetical protein
MAPPETMTRKVHTFEPHSGGRFRIWLTYQDPKQGPGGEATEDTDTVQGRFVELVPDRKIILASKSNRLIRHSPAR